MQSLLSSFSSYFNRGSEEQSQKVWQHINVNFPAIIIEIIRYCAKLIGETASHTSMEWANFYPAARSCVCYNVAGERESALHNWMQFEMLPSRIVCDVRCLLINYILALESLHVWLMMVMDHQYIPFVFFFGRCESTETETEFLFLVFYSSKGID